LAGFEVTLIGRFWVTAEGTPALCNFFKHAHCSKATTVNAFIAMLRLYFGMSRNSGAKQG
jgi:hypothetical protein